MKYILGSLLQNEKLVYGVKPHWIIFSSGVWAMFFSVVVLALHPIPPTLFSYHHWTINEIAAAVLFVVGAYWFSQAYIYYMTSEYGITDKRVLIKTGWIRRASLELMIDKVEGVLIDQTIIGRVLNYGAITIIGTGGTKDRFPFIPDPLMFRKVVQQQVSDMENKMMHSK